MKKIVTILSLFVFTSFVFAQKGKLAGKVSDKASGEDIIGATVLIEGTTNGVTTDLDGKYFMQLAPGTYNVVISYVSYKTKKFEGVVISDGELTSINVPLEESSTELEEVVIQGEIKKESSAALLIQQKNAASMSSGISADLIRKMPDRTTADIIKRVAGATIQDGKFAIIRGMQDRYNYGMINGAPLPSSEPDRKAFSLDLVPAQVVDNMIISKTATPDMPGDFAGGLIQINTRDIPDENKVFVNIGGGYHSITTFRDFNKSPQSGGIDILGMSNSSRQLSKDVVSTSLAQDPANSITQNPQQLVDQTKLFNNDFAPKLGKALPNMSLQIGASKRAKIAGNDFGVIGAITYNNSNVFEPYERNSPVISDASNYRRDSTTQGFFYNYNRYRNNINLGGILNFTYKVGQKNKFFFKNLLTQVATDQTILRDGIVYNVNLPRPFGNEKDIAFFYQSNRSYFGQFGGEHILNDARKVKLNYVLGYTNIFMQVPDFKRNFSRAEADTRAQADTAEANRKLNGLPFSPGSPNNPGRFFFDLKESSVSANYDVSVLVNEIRTTFKVGGMNHLRTREFEGRSFNFNNALLDAPILVDPLLKFGQIKQDLSSTLGADSNISANRYYQVESTQGSDRYSASSSLHAGFLMGETKLLPNLKIIWGARLEMFNQKIKSIAQGKLIDTSITWIDPLPSLNIIYGLTEQINLRGSYSRTLSRPEFREFAPLAFYDFTRNSVFVGNPKLTRAIIDNIDLKFEIYPNPGQMFSVNPFVKLFQNPVENIIQPSQGGISQISYQNANSAYVGGVELEGRTNLAFINKDAKILENFVVFANYSQIWSQVNQDNIIGITDDVKIRPLQGQSPYIFNVGLQYNTENDFNITLTANQYGRRIAFVGQENKFQIWEAPRFVTDFSISKTFNKKLNIKGTIGDIFAQDLIYYNDLNRNGSYNQVGDEVFEKYRRGYTVSLSAGYTF